MPQWWSDIHFPLKPGRLKYGSWVWIPPAAPYRERGVMVTRLLWEQELQFKSDVFDQLVSQHAFHKIPFLLFLALQKWSNRTQQAKYIMRRSQAVKAGSFEVPIAKVRFFPAQFICHSGGIDLHIYFRGRRRKACEFESRLWHHGHRMVAYRLLISFDCHYYSRLASDGAVVLCKLGFHAAGVQPHKTPTSR